MGTTSAGAARAGAERARRTDFELAGVQGLVLGCLPPAGEQGTCVNGGSIALDHPLGATGGMLVGTMLDELERRDVTRGPVIMCIGRGMGIATIVEQI